MEWETRKKRRSIVDFDQWHEIKLAKGREEYLMRLSDIFLKAGYCLRCAYGDLNYFFCLPKRWRDIISESDYGFYSFPVSTLCLYFVNEKKDEGNCLVCSLFNNCPICLKLHDYGKESWGGCDDNLI